MTSSSGAPWRPFRAGATVGEIGSEAGVILRDEEYAESARITLEKPEPRKPFGRTLIRYAMTCGIYGWMVHTRFFTTEEDATRAYEALKRELARISDTLPEVSATDPEVDTKVESAAKELGAFTERFP